MASHKPLKSVSHNFGHSFVSLMNYIEDDYFLGHLLKQVKKTKLNRLEIDVLNQIVNPKELLTKPISDSIGYWIKWFPTLVETSKTKLDFVNSVKVTIEFDLSKTQTDPEGYMPLAGSPYFCEVIIIDDKGKEYKSIQSDWWYPEK